jgi:hypothetical protein
MLPWAFLLACHRNVDPHDAPVDLSQLPEMRQQDLVVVLETTHYVVLTPVKRLLSNLEQWVREHDYIRDDKALLVAVQQASLRQARTRGFRVLRVDGVAKARGLGDRLAYRTADLLRANNCLVYNKQHKLIEPTCREFNTSSPGGYEGHGFSVSKDTILEVVDKVY